MITLDEAKRRGLVVLLLNATNYVDVFSDYMTAREVSSTYWEMARLVHPDAGGDTEAFQKLNQFKADADWMIQQGRYGEPVMLAKIQSRKASHQVTRKFATGDITTLYLASTVRATDTTVVGEKSILKVAKSPKDNDLLAAEAKAIKLLHSMDDVLHRHIPVLLDSFAYPEGRRRANAIGFQEGYTVAQLSRAFPAGLDPLHMVWIFRRLLMTLGFIHDSGVVHGAVLPDHILVEPVDHKVILLDWCYSSLGTDSTFPPIKAIATNFRDWYPQEVLEKEEPGPATDLYMAARCMAELSPVAPKPLRAFLKGCQLTKKSMRPGNAWGLLREFDDLLEGMGVPYYPRRFKEFHVPRGAE